ncbi:hypothetical protein L1987_48052 [Smallanthus sonchifolius]|uniref:Uncharacterized protein n=1 Tax=Smallanthus sonchifolius TaxID=185202 RepID=A0ACB9FQQ7_9ASTR|nr:hypothetical protein L1987_48052 [Smallanthus sonchifolius]
MQKHKMGTDDGGSGPSNKKGGWKTVRHNILEGAPGTLDNIHDDSVAVHSVKIADREVKERSSRIQHVSKMLKYWTAVSKGQPTATHAFKGLMFIRRSAWNALDKKFDELTKESDGLLQRSRFGECIGMNKDSNDFAEGLFDSLCRRRNITGDKINKAQFMEVDKDEDGRITEDEVREIDKVEKLLKDAATRNKRERQHLSESSRHQHKPTHSPTRKQYEDLKYFLHDNWRRCWVVILWIGIMVGLFTWKYIQYKHRAVYDVLGVCVSIAKGAAETLKLNMAIMLLPFCRNTITWLRNKTKLGAVVPFDDNINFHQVIAVAIAIGVGLHAISHLACDFPRLIHATEEEYKLTHQFFEDQAKNYWHFMKEVVLEKEMILGIS